MLPIYILSKNNIKPSNGVLYQWLNITVRRCSSSDSSDSDSDNEKGKKIHVKDTKSAASNPNHGLGSFLDNMIQNTSSQTVKNIKPSHSETILTKEQKSKTTKTDTENNLMDFLNTMLQAKKLQKTIDVAVQPRKKLNKSRNTNKEQVPYEKKVISAAEDVATTLGGDKAKTTSDLLQKIVSHNMELQNNDNKSITELLMNNKKTSADNVNSYKDSMQINDIRTNNKTTQLPEYKEQDNVINEIQSSKKSVIQSLLEDYKTRPVIENSISRQILKDNKNIAHKLQNKSRERQEIDIWNGQPTIIFDNMGIASLNIPELKTWTMLEQKELKAVSTHPPANIFQEFILWTEQGKLWKFPIDNEQGMEEEQNVHFSEHVFMERHLKEWCPKSGPIRHFMELVCTGLSKNPYLTVEEKIDHIMWYKEYFESKKDIIQEIIQNPLPDKPESITE